MKDIIESYKQFIEGKDEDWIYDETYRFLSDLSRSDACTIMDYLLEQYPLPTPTSKK